MADRNVNPDKRIRSLKDLQTIKEKVMAETALREDGYRACVTVHMGTCGIASGSREVMSVLMDEIASSERSDIRLTTSGCIGVCSHEPVMTVDLLGGETVLYGDLDPEKARLVFREHILGGTVVPQFVVSLGAGSAQERKGNRQ